MFSYIVGLLCVHTYQAVFNLFHFFKLLYSYEDSLNALQGVLVNVILLAKFGYLRSVKYNSLTDASISINLYASAVN